MNNDDRKEAEMWAQLMEELKSERRKNAALVETLERIQNFVEVIKATTHELIAKLEC